MQGIPNRVFYGGLGSRKKPIPLPVTISEINALADYYPLKEVRALFRTCYLFGVRVGEALQLKVTDFQLTADEYGRDVIVATVLTEKNRINPIRHVPAITGSPKELTPFQQEEAEIAAKLTEYIGELQDKQGLLFPSLMVDTDKEKARKRADYYLRKQHLEIRAIQTQPKAAMVTLPDFALHAHYLRHVRLTHLRAEYRYDALDLMQYAGWTDTRPAVVYLQLDWRQLAGAMKPKGASK